MLRIASFAKSTPQAVLKGSRGLYRSQSLAFTAATSGTEEPGQAFPKKVDLWERIKANTIKEVKQRDRSAGRQQNGRKGSDARTGGNNQRQSNGPRTNNRRPAAAAAAAPAAPQNVVNSEVKMSEDNSANSNSNYGVRNTDNVRRADGPTNERRGQFSSSRYQRPFRSPRSFKNNRDDDPSSRYSRRSNFDSRSTRSDTFSDTGSVSGRESYDGKKKESLMSEVDAALLFDDDFFVNKMKENVWEIVDDDADPMDKILSEAYLNSVYSSEHTFRAVYGAPQFNNHFKLPKPRSLHQLRCALEPKINCDPNSDGYKMALEAWTVLQHNYYYSDREKRKIVNGIANTANQALEHCANLPPNPPRRKVADGEDVDPDSLDLGYNPADDPAVDPDYYRGPPSLEVVDERKVEEEEARQLEAIKQEFLAKRKVYEEEEKWEGEAFADEDEYEAWLAEKKKQKK